MTNQRYLQILEKKRRFTQMSLPLCMYIRNLETDKILRVSNTQVFWKNHYQIVILSPPDSEVFRSFICVFERGSPVSKCKKWSLSPISRIVLEKNIWSKTDYVIPDPSRKSSDFDLLNKSFM